MGNIKTASDSLPWDMIGKLAEEGKHKKDFEGITTDAFRFAVNEDNYSQLVESAWKSLKRTDPNATLEQAESLADMMQIFARMVVGRLDETSEQK